jgi:FkbM family methyltransferase
MYYSQFGEDEILEWLFADRATGVAVEVGANDGVHGSTTLTFEKKGWQCILVEPTPQLVEAIRKVRTARVFPCAASDKQGTATFHVASGGHLAHSLSSLSANEVQKQGVTLQPIEVPLRRLDDILAEANLSPIDFITIDVEGHEPAALAGLTLSRWKPGIVLIENNSNTTAPSDRAAAEHLANAGYTFFLRTGVNDWYIDPNNAALDARRQTLAFKLTVLKRRLKNLVRNAAWTNVRASR